MTRINSNVHPTRLTDEHLRAEHREIKRLCKVFYQRALKRALGVIPKEFSKKQSEELLWK